MFEIPSVSQEHVASIQPEMGGADLLFQLKLLEMS